MEDKPKKRRSRAKAGEPMKNTPFLVMMEEATMSKLEDIAASRRVSKGEMVRALICSFWASKEQRNYRDRKIEQENVREMP